MPFWCMEEFCKIRDFSLSIFIILLTSINTLEGQWLGANILLFVSSGCEKWCCHTYSQYEKLFSKYDKEKFSMTIDGTTT